MIKAWCINKEMWLPLKTRNIYGMPNFLPPVKSISALEDDGMINIAPWYVDSPSLSYENKIVRLGDTLFYEFQHLPIIPIICSMSDDVSNMSFYNWLNDFKELGILISTGRKQIRLLENTNSPIPKKRTTSNLRRLIPPITIVEKVLVPQTSTVETEINYVLIEGGKRLNIECNICLDEMVSPTWICINGHSICSICRHQVLCCPTCRDGFVARNFTLDDVIESNKLCGK
jgi:hypothetical protein